MTLLAPRLQPVLCVTAGWTSELRPNDDDGAADLLP